MNTHTTFSQKSSASRPKGTAPVNVWVWSWQHLLASPQRTHTHAFPLSVGRLCKAPKHTLPKHSQMTALCQISFIHRIYYTLNKQWRCGVGFGVERRWCESKRMTHTHTLWSRAPNRLNIHNHEQVVFINIYCTFGGADSETLLAGSAIYIYIYI